MQLRYQSVNLSTELSKDETRNHPHYHPNVHDVNFCLNRNKTVQYHGYNRLWILHCNLKTVEKLHFLSVHGHSNRANEIAENLTATLQIAPHK